MASLQQEKQKPPNTKAYGSTNTNSRTQESTDDEGSSQYSSSHHKIPSKTDPPSNEYVLNVAFLSFVGFMALQAFFALLANSQSMMADSEAMSVDALTYLFNMCAERFKHRPLSPKELELPVAVRTHQREMHRLYLELIPPLISVVTLILVTIHAIQEAWETLYGLGRGEEEEDVSAGLMLFFSGLNLVLDAVNVACFARAHQAYGLQATAVAATTGTENHWKHQQQERESLSLLEQQQHQQQNAMGLTLLQEGHPSLEMAGSHTADNNSTPQDDYLESWFGDVNLNMCSAWTVS